MSIEAQIFTKSKNSKHMIRCVVEMTPLCNLSCEMCGISLKPCEVSKFGEILKLNEWFFLLDQLAEYGVLYLCLSGGEPLLHPDFATLYEYAYKRGFIIEIRTNGTLLSKFSELFGKLPPRQIGISIYGSSNEMYKKMTGDDHGYDHLISGLESIKTIPSKKHFTCTMTKTNVRCFADIAELASTYNASLGMISDIFPHIKGKRNNIATRLSPAECAAIACYPPKQIVTALETARMLDEEYSGEFDRKLTERRTPLSVCNGCQIGGCIKWDGRMTFCPEIDALHAEPLRIGLQAAWEELLQKRDAFLQASEMCEHCGIRQYCRGACPARFLLETGDVRKPCETICKTAFFTKLLHERKV